MYPIEYTCTNEDTMSTGINIETVNVSKLKPQDRLRDSTSIHLIRYIVTGILFRPTSIKTTTAKKVVIRTQVQVINCDPLIPIFLPKNPDAIDPKSGNNINAKYIIYILLLYYLLIYKMLQVYLNLLQILLQLLLLYK